MIFFEVSIEHQLSKVITSNYLDEESFRTKTEFWKLTQISAYQKSVLIFSWHNFDKIIGISWAEFETFAVVAQFVMNFFAFLFKIKIKLEGIIL